MATPLNVAMFSIHNYFISGDVDPYNYSISLCCFVMIIEEKCKLNFVHQICMKVYNYISGTQFQKSVLNVFTKLLLLLSVFSFVVFFFLVFFLCGLISCYLQTFLLVGLVMFDIAHFNCYILTKIIQTMNDLYIFFVFAHFFLINRYKLQIIALISILYK